MLLFMQKEYSNILVRMPNWLGDAVMATPLLKDLRRHFPESKLTTMCQGGVGTLLHGNPYIDEIFVFTRPNAFSFRQEERDLIERIRQGKYDLGVLVPNSLSSAWYLWRGKVKERIGFSHNIRSFLLTRALPFPKERGKEHQVITYKRLLLSLGIPLSSSFPELFVLEQEREAALELLTQLRVPKGGKIIGINPGAAYGSAKCWLPDRFRSLITKLIQDPLVTILCFGDRAGASVVHEICQGFSPQVIDLAGKTNLRELMALIEQCTVLVTNDSGPMHIAAALQTPLVALFGSTNPIATGPYEQGDIIYKHVSCSPCYKRTCPIDFKCMKEISVEDVYQTVIRRLSSSDRPL